MVLVGEKERKGEERKREKEGEKKGKKGEKRKKREKEVLTQTMFITYILLFSQYIALITTCCVFSEYTSILFHCLIMTDDTDDQSCTLRMFSFLEREYFLYENINKIHTRISKNTNIHS